MANYAVNILGYLALVAIIAGSSVWCLVTVHEWIQTIARRKRLQIEDTIRLEVRNAIAGRLIQDSYWFGEDPPTAKLFLRTAQEVLNSGWMPVSNIRDEWRGWKAECEAKRTN